MPFFGGEGDFDTALYFPIEEIDELFVRATTERFYQEDGAVPSMLRHPTKTTTHTKLINVGNHCEH